MKRILSLTLILILCLSLAGCGGNASSSSAASAPQASGPASSGTVASQVESAVPESQPAEETEIRVAALQGPTGMGMAQIVDKYNCALAASADEITPQLVQGQLDIAAVPANLASVLYNNTEGKIQVLAINTLGVLYLVENGDTVHSVEDLRGKTIYSAGKGATPEYALTYMLSQNGIDPQQDVTIEWKSEHAECLSALLAGENAVAMLPQPFVTTAQMKNEGIRAALDLNEEWKSLSSAEGKSAALITGVAVARKEFVEENPELTAAFLEDYQASVEYVNSDTEGAAALIGGLGFLPEAVAKKALPECNITFIAGEEMKEKLSGYLQTLFDQNPKAVGGTMPGEDFYYIG